MVLITVSSCSKEELVSWQTSHDFTIENTMGEEINMIQDLDTHAVASNGHNGTDGKSFIKGTQVAGSASKYIDRKSVGFSFYLSYHFTGDEYEDGFSESIFQSLWKVGKVYDLGKEDEEYYENPYVYIGMENEKGILKQYVTKK